MAFFSAQAISRPPLGRPLGQPAASFAALLFSRLSGHSRRRAEEILTANPDKASGAIWSVASAAATAGCKTAADFEAWLQRKPTSNP